MNYSQLRFPVVVVLIGFLLGLIGDLSFYGKPAGISFPLFITSLLIALAGIAIYEEAAVTRGNLWLVVPLLFLSAMSVVRAAPLLRFLNIAGTLGLLALIVGQFTSSPLTRLNLGGYTASVVKASMLSLVLAVPILGQAIKKLLTMDRGQAKLVRRVLAGLLIAAPLLIIFTALFASADLLFGNMVDRMLSIFRFDIPDLFGHLMLIASLTWLVIGVFGYALVSGSGEEEDEQEPVEGEVLPESEQPKPAATSGFKHWLGMVEASVVLFSIDALFLLFVAIQFAALFGGEAFLRRQGLTYSEYARRGFFELVTVAVITLVLILALDWITRRENRGHHRIFLLGSGSMVGLTVIILTSAFMRMALYESAYGFTRLRVHTHVFMVWLGLLMIFFIITLALKHTRLFATGLLVFAIGYTITLNFLNPDAFIVRQNLARYDRGLELDVDYLGSLSDDAVPLLVPLLYDYDQEIGAAAGPWLHYHLDRLDSRQAKAGWTSYHVSHNRAYRLLDLNRELIEQFDPAYRWSSYDEYR